MSNPNGRFGSITGIEQSRPKCPLYGQLRTFVAPIETGFLSVRILADQVGEFMQVGVAASGWIVVSPRVSNAGRFNITPVAGKRAAYSAASAAGWPRRLAFFFRQP